MLFKNKHFKLYKSTVAFLLLLAAFIILIPEEFSDDQQEYYEVVSNGVIWPVESLGDLKSFAMWILSAPPRFIGADSLTAIKIFNFVSFVFLLGWLSRISNVGRERRLLVVIMLPLVAIHATLFLREVYIYLLLILFFIALLRDKRLCQASLVVFIGLVRPDSLVLVFPLLMALRFRRSISILFAYTMIVVLSVTQVPEIQALLHGYSLLFDVRPAYPTDGLLNLLFPSGGSTIAALICAVESIALFCVVGFAYFRGYFSMPLIVSILCGLAIGSVLVGSVSDNPGFVGRIRSPFYLTILLVIIFKVRAFDRGRRNAVRTIDSVETDKVVM